MLEDPEGPCWPTGPSLRGVCAGIGRLRQKRAALPYKYHLSCAHLAAHHLQSSLLFLKSRHIACYCAIKGELDPQPLIEIAWSMRKHIYLPVLDPIRKGYLRFVPYSAQTRFKKNRYGILLLGFQNQTSFLVNIYYHQDHFGKEK